MSRFRIFFFCLIIFSTRSFGQNQTSAKTSELIVTYDLNSPLSSGALQIPFDRRFTFRVLKYNTQNITKIFAYEATFDHGRRSLKMDNHVRKLSIPDLKLDFLAHSDTLDIYFPALKPSVHFDIAVVRTLTNENLKLAYTLNENIFNGNLADASKEFIDLKNNTTDMNIRFFTYGALADYQVFYTAQLAAPYNQLHNNANFTITPLPTQSELEILGEKFKNNHIKFHDDNRLVRITSEANVANIFLGTLTVKYDNATDPAKMGDFDTRAKNLQASMIYFDTLTNAIDACLAIQDDADLKEIQAKVEAISTALVNNKKFLRKNLDQITTAMTKNTDINEVDILIGDTEAKDVKTKGGNILTLDLGFANIITGDVTGTLKYIPKPYYGVNIYFRPIDKNTRNRDFPSSYKKNKSSGDVLDYNIATVTSVWQHLSLTVGLTFGSSSNSQFDYLFNNSVLLIGPGYRFYKFFRVSTGLALLKRTSKDPLTNDKKVIGGYYASLSADIDLVQGIKDFISMITK